MNYESLENWKAMKSRDWKLDAGSLKPVFRVSILNYQLTILVILLLAPIIVQSQVHTLTLDSVLHIIEKQNPMLQTYRNRTQAMNAYVAGSKV